MTARRTRTALPKRHRLKVKRNRPPKKRLWLRSRDYWVGWGCAAAAVVCVILGLSRHLFLIPGGLFFVAAVLSHRRHAKKYRAGLGLW
ncbi:hypothetical protein JXA88_19115 [Candidatus Fermentibacteria bacterium]|nr:hypothetical protein [Candidatus Fermentibacteria bacterium]